MDEYPEGAVFHVLLHWHLRINGTRPPGVKQGIWKYLSFAHEVRASSAAVGQWCSGLVVPTKIPINTILNAILGDAPRRDSEKYAKWRQDLRAAFEAASEKSSGGDTVATLLRDVRTALSVDDHPVADDTIIPLDLLAKFDTRGPRRFSPLNDRLPFVGRASERESLIQFAECEDRFAWWLVSGPGGTGKTRLAREICLALQARGWRAGFLPEGWSDASRNIHAWRPRKPTLIVIDTMAERGDAVRRLAHWLSCELSVGCPFGPDRGDWSYQASALTGGSE